MSKIVPAKNLKAVEKMAELGELKKAPSTHDSKILPAKTVRPHKRVGELVFRLEANGGVGIECSIPGDPFYVRAMASACLGFVREMEMKGLLRGVPTNGSK